MRDRVVTAIKKVKDNDWIDVLQKCPGPEERHEKLAELLPESKDWCPSIVKRQLIFFLQHVFKIELGVCKHYIIDDHRQYCRFNGEKTECRCVIPQPFCVIRDQ